MENSDSQAPDLPSLLASEVFSAPSSDIEALSQHVLDIQNTLQLAQEHLQALGNVEVDGLAIDTETLHIMYCRLPERLDLYSKVYHNWEAAETSAYEKSEVRFSLGHVRRLQVVAKNIQRITAEALGIPDPEMQQTMLEAQLMGAGKMRFDD